jgi:hypothetical protein
MMLSRDGISGLVCLAISVILLTQTFGLPPAAIVPIGPAFYPRVVLSILMLLSVILIALDFRAMRTAAAPAAAPAAGPPPNYHLVLATFIEFALHPATAAARLPDRDIPVRALFAGHAGMAAQQQALAARDRGRCSNQSHLLPGLPGLPVAAAAAGHVEQHVSHYELLLTHMGTVLQMQYLVPLLVGTIAGVVGGALPGVTITMTVIVVLPFTFGLDPLQGLAAMIGVYVGGSAGGSIPRA